jgi:hypothetical protein
MKRYMSGLGAALAIALLVVGIAPALAQDSETQPERTLTGQLSMDDSGAYFLVEQESGDNIRLRGPADLSDHVDAKVMVTGRWEADEKGEYFAVRSVERASDESES